VLRTLRFELYNNNTGIIKSPDLLGIIREKLSVADENARFALKHNKFAQTRKYIITKSGRFPIGIFKLIKDVVDGLDIDVKFEYSADFKDCCIPSYTIPDMELAELGMTPHDYQLTSVNRMLKIGRGVILIGTGGGKTFIMSLLAKTLFKYKRVKKVLIIVPTLQLVEQTHSDFLEYGFDPSTISKWSGEHDKQDTDIVVVNTGILQSDNSDLKFLKDIDLLLIDEVHILKKGNAINKIIDKIPAVNRFGFTGTMPENPIDQWNVIGKTGPILFDKSSKALRDGKFISDAKIDIVRINYNIDDLHELHNILGATVQKYMGEIEFMINNTYRNALIAKSAEVCKGNTLIMVDRIIHGELLYDILKKNTNSDVYFIQGNVGVEEREKVRDLMEQKSNIICIAISKIFSTGINIKNIHNIIFATPGKAKVKLIQSIGRGLRLHVSKSILRVIDFADNLHYSSRHLDKRMKLYDSEKLNYETRNIKQPQKKG